MIKHIVMWKFRIIYVFFIYIISEFESLEDLQKYKTDPRHVRVSNMCKEIRTKRTAFDFEE